MAQHTDARSLMDRARDGAFNKLDAQRDRAATGLTSMVEALRQSGRQLEGEHATVASYVDTAASQLERFSGEIRERDLKQIVTDVERFARRRPSVFLGSAFALGIAAARFLKSSGEGDGDSVRYGLPASAGVETRSSSSPRGPNWPTEPVAGRGGYASSTNVGGG